MRFDIKDPVDGSLLLTRWVFRRNIAVHRFHKPQDESHGLHDHPCGFWTFPLTLRGYREEVLQADGTVRVEHVPGLRWTHRRAEHTHRLLDAFWSLVIMDTNKPPNEFGFWES